MNIYTLLNVPADLASYTPLNVGEDSSVIRYLDGPARIIVTMTDSKGRDYKLPMSPGDQFTLDGSRHFRRCEVGNTDSVVGRVDLLIGRGDLKSNPKLAGATETPKDVVVSMDMTQLATRYSCVGINNLSTSSYAAEVISIVVYPTSTDKFNLTLCAADYATIHALSPFQFPNSAVTRLADYSNGSSGVRRFYGATGIGLAPEDMADTAGVAWHQYFINAGVGALGQILPIHFDFSETPIVVRPNQLLLLFPVAQNVTISAMFQWRERRVL